MQILLHACCAPCSTYVVKTMLARGLGVSLFFYNPNIHPYDEFQKRKETLNDWARTIDIKVHYPVNVDVASWAQAVGIDVENRCLACYRLRLAATAVRARELEIEYFSTTLLISPYQNHAEIRIIGEEEARRNGVNFYYEDFRVGFASSQQSAKELGLYRQNYCGCFLSEFEKKNKKAAKK
ncbi:MAG: epoxyqueuosine reductase QueH [bacterium]|nr:epoxyqueuosine reductase QueH [bacterium]